MVEIELAKRELEVMAVLWELGSARVSEVRERLAADLAYTTVLTVLRTLEEKGFVGHTQPDKAYVYHPLVERESAEASAVSRLVTRMFGGSPELLLTHLVSDRALTKSELETLRALVDRRLDSEE